MAAVKQQGLSIAAIHAGHFPDENGVVAGGMFRHDIAGEMRQGILK